MGCACTILKVSKIIKYIMLGNFQNHDVTKTGFTWPKSQTRLGKKMESSVHQSQNNTPFVQNNSSGIQAIDLQFIFKNEDKQDRITYLYAIQMRVSDSRQNISINSERK